MSAVRPGWNLERLRGLMDDAVARCRLDLSGAEVLTEAATGPFVVTPVLAALGGAKRVRALVGSNDCGTEIAAQTHDLARASGVVDRIELHERKTRSVIGRADIVASGALIDAAMIRQMKPSAVITLMHEAWELPRGRVDLTACRKRGIAVAGTNGRHPAVHVYSYLGVAVVRLLLDAGVAVQGCTILLLCDNPFASSLVRGLTNAGARVALAARPSEVAPGRSFDAIVVALKHRFRPLIAARDLAARWPGAVIAQFCGDLDRKGLDAVHALLWPIAPPPRGHLGTLCASIGPEPIVRLQAGGLKVGEVLSRGVHALPEDFDYIQALDGETVPA